MSFFCKGPLQHDEQDRCARARTEKSLGSCSWAEQDLLGSPLGEGLHGSVPMHSHSNRVSLFLLATSVLSW